MAEVNLQALVGRLSRYCQRSLFDAASMCGSLEHYEITVEHLLLQFVDDESHDFALILRHFDVDRTRVKKALHDTLKLSRTGNTDRPRYSRFVAEWFQEAWLLASIEANQPDVRSGALIVALLLNPGRLGQDLYMNEMQAISPEKLRKEWLDITTGSKEEVVSVRSAAAAGTASDQFGDDTALGRFAINFTGRAREGAIDPVFCRDPEIRQIIDILGRRRKNNPIAVGEAGVGKTAVIEGLALKIVQGEVPDVLRDVEIFGLDLGLLQAGAGVRGEFENRIKGVIAEVKASPKPIILFIDEAHTLIGAGGPAGGGDAANLLKPALARGELRTIAATTWSEYKKYFEKDAALARRFQLVTLDEPSPENAVVILRGLRETYEVAHGVYIRDDAIVAAAQLSARYISGRQLPDKAVDLLDTACARVKISMSAKPDQIDDQERTIQTLERELKALERDRHAGSGDDPERVEALQSDLQVARADLDELTMRWEREQGCVEEVLARRRELVNGTEAAGGHCASAGAEAAQQSMAAAKAKLSELQGHDPLIHFEVGPDVVSKVVADWTGIPAGNMIKDEALAILQFQENLQQRIKGQDHAIAAIDRRIRAAKAGVGNPNAPMGVFLFVGPSGVGKTECALGMADLLFGGERFLITINMSEFQEKHTVSRLIGSPPGYVGYGEGGLLTEAVRQRPYAVVLMDEVEKADSEVMNLFYQVFDKGLLTDGEGREVDFKNTVICMTSNLASDRIMQLCSDGNPPDPNTLVSAIRPILSRYFKPALLARMDIVPFVPISADVMGGIVELKLQQLATRLQNSQNIRFSYTPQVVEQIASRCTEVETGARNIDHIMNGTLLPEISTEILQTLSTDTAYHTLALSIGADGRFAYDFQV